VDAERFLITPTGRDRCSLDGEDIVLIDHGRREANKVPSRSVRLHQAIYARHPEIGCVITAQPPHATAYAITPQKFDTRAMSESYAILRDVPLLPFEAKYEDREGVAAALSADRPVLLIQNDCVLATGTSLLQAYDRLEVAEFSARSLIDSFSLGGPVPIEAAEIAEMEARLSK
jgi:L-fuculose-phosphate aldolase